eukprot:5885568-Pleurochrysis_carterae.AAC.2
MFDCVRTYRAVLGCRLCLLRTAFSVNAASRHTRNTWSGTKVKRARAFSVLSPAWPSDAVS